MDTKWDLLERMDKRDNTVCHLTACLKAVSLELSAFDPGQPDVVVTRRRRWNGSFLQQVEEDENEEMGQAGYPKTKVIISGSRI